MLQAAWPIKGPEPVAARSWASCCQASHALASRGAGLQSPAPLIAHSLGGRGHPAGLVHRLADLEVRHLWGTTGAGGGGQQV